MYDHVDYDSRIERNFAEQLENASDQVKRFAKLPRRFKVRPTVGEYSPDRAIVCDVDGAEKLYLARETKDKLSVHQLYWDEAMKIRFALRHFNADPVGAIDYTNTTDHDGLRIELDLGGEAR
jgi:type III restriction enzyme